MEPGGCIIPFGQNLKSSCFIREKEYSRNLFVGEIDMEVLLPISNIWRFKICHMKAELAVRCSYSVSFRLKEAADDKEA